jgi:hypothetical protein
LKYHRELIIITEQEQGPEDKLHSCIQLPTVHFEDGGLKMEELRRRRRKRKRRNIWKKKEEKTEVARLFASLLKRNTNTRTMTRATSNTAPTAPRSPYTRLFWTPQSQVSPVYQWVSVVRHLRWKRETERREQDQLGPGSTGD